MENLLLVDCCSFNGFEFNLNEASGSRSLAKFRGKFQEAEATNKNMRMYPYDVLFENVQRLKEAIADRRLVGELDHPTDSIIHYANSSHIVTKLWWDGNILMGEGEILDTPSGQILKCLIDSGVKVGISSRGVGNGKVNEDGILVIGESYKLITFDAVADPSTYAAFQEKVMGKNETAQINQPSSKMINRGGILNMLQKSQVRNNNSMKIESSGIHTLNKDLLIAYLDGLTQVQSEHLKSRLS